MSSSTQSAMPLVADETTVRQLTRIWENILGIESIEADQDYFDLGGDSALAVQMFAQIEKVFNIKLPLATLYEAPTIEDLARILGGEVESAGWSPLVAIQPSGWRPPFFCFHGAGGNVLSYRKLAYFLGGDQPVYGLQSQGLDGTTPPLTTIEQMATLYVKHIRKVQPHGPYLLGGYCMGGTLAYEAAQQLQAMGESIALLALLDTMNWHKVPLTISSRSSHAVQRVLFHAASFLSLNSSGKLRFFEEKLDVLRRRIPVWGSVLGSKIINRATVEPTSNSAALGNIWRMNDRAAWHYIPQPYPGKVTDFRPAKQYRVFSRPDLKWERLAQGGQDVIVLSMYPAAMLLEPYVKDLARALRASMDAAMKRYGSEKCY